MIKVLLIIICLLAALFLLSLIIYFLNLDMKLMTKIAPILNRHYDKIKRDRRL